MRVMIIKNDDRESGWSSSECWWAVLLKCFMKIQFMNTKNTSQNLRRTSRFRSVFGAPSAPEGPFGVSIGHRKLMNFFRNGSHGPNFYGDVSDVQIWQPTGGDLHHWTTNPGSPGSAGQTIIIEYSPMDLHKLDGATLQMRIPSGHGDRWWPWWVGHVLMGHVQFNVS